MDHAVNSKSNSKRKKNASENLHAGHRQRLKKRFLHEGLESFEEHQIYELLLFYSIPRRDTNPTAHILLNAFHSFSGVMDADPEALLQTDQIGSATARLLKLIPLLSKQYCSEKFRKEKRFLKSGDTAAYILANYPSDPLYTLRLSCFDNGSHLLSCEAVQHDCRLDELPSAHKILTSAFLRTAARIVLSIKLPFFSKTITQQEYDALLSLNSALFSTGISFLDFLVLVEDRWISLFQIMTSDRAVRFNRIPHRDVEKKYEDTSAASCRELLAELLSFSLPKKNDPFLLADRLLNRFSSLSYIFDARYEELITVDGVSENTAVLLKLIPPLSSRYETDRIIQKEDLNSTKKIVDFLIRYYVHRTVESSLLLCFDDRNTCCSLDTVSDGSVGYTYLDMRKILEIAYAHRASSVLLAHNHPGGVAVPSEEDLAATQELQRTLKSAGILLKDHILIAGNKWISIGEALFGTSYTNSSEAIAFSPKNTRHKGNGQNKSRRKNTEQSN